MNTWAPLSLLDNWKSYRITIESAVEACKWPLTDSSGIWFAASVERSHSLWWHPQHLRGQSAVILTSVCNVHHSYNVQVQQQTTIGRVNGKNHFDSCTIEDVLVRKTYNSEIMHTGKDKGVGWNRAWWECVISFSIQVLLHSDNCPFGIFCHLWPQLLSYKNLTTK